MKLTPIDEQIIIIRLGADHEFKSRFPSIILPDTMYEDPSGVGVVHDFDRGDSIHSGLKPLRDLIKPGDLVRFTRHGTGRRFMDVTGDREIVLPDDNGIPTTYSFIRREHLLAVVDLDSLSPRMGKGLGDGVCSATEAAQITHNLIKYELLHQSYFNVVFEETDQIEVYREPDDDEDVQRNRKVYEWRQPETSFTEVIQEMLRKVLRVEPEGRTNIFLVEPEEIKRYLCALNLSQFHCITQTSDRISLGADWSLEEMINEIDFANRIAVTTGDVYLQNHRHALSVIDSDKLYLFDIGLLNADNLEIVGP